MRTLVVGVGAYDIWMGSLVNVLAMETHIHPCYFDRATCFFSRWHDYGLFNRWIL